MYCSSCCFQINDNDKFCSKCGKAPIKNNKENTLNKPADDEIKIETANTDKSGYNKTVIAVVSTIIGLAVVYFAYQEYKQYQAEKEAGQAIEMIFNLFK